jgi:hypothetical protein
MTGGPMPYVLDVGPYFSVLEDRLSTPDRRAAILTLLRNGALVSDIAGLESTSLDGDGHGADPGYRVKVLNECWFGMKQNAAGGWDPQPNVFPTGFWNGYQGDTHAIFRAGLIRAIEVSLGIEHGAPWPGPNQNGPYENDIAGIGKRISNWVKNVTGVSRDCPIELSWICQGPFFQCWVTWMKKPDGSGHVSLMFTTPAAKGLSVKAKITRPAPADPEYACPPRPGAYAVGRGVWVLGHEDYTDTPGFSTLGSSVTGITTPTIEYHPKSTAVVCVAPAEWEAGVLAAGRPYTP